MGGFRARDDDRERYVEVIQTAYVDGQLGAEDRELRVSRALTAETLDELEALTRDLQNQPARTIVQTPPPRVVAPEPVVLPEPVPWPVPVRRSAAPKVIGSVVSGLVALAVMALVVPSQDPVGSIYGEEQFSYDDGVPAADYALTDAGVRKLVRRYRAKFHTSEARRVAFFSYRVVVQVPVDGAEPRYEEWTWDGDEWQRVERAQVIDGPAGTFDLDTLDVKQLFENIDVATGDLGVSDAEVQRVELDGTAVGSGTITIHVRNGRGDTATLRTTPQGSRTRSEPFEG